MISAIKLFSLLTATLGLASCAGLFCPKPNENELIQKREEKHSYYDFIALADLYKKRLFKVKAHDKNGFGFILSSAEGGKFIGITANHVIDSSTDRVSITLCENESDILNAKIINRNVDHDIAFLEFQSQKTIPYSKRFFSDSSEPGIPIMHIGLDKSCIAAPIGPIKRFLRDSEQIEITGTARPGSSGGIIFSEYGAEGLLVRSSSFPKRSLAVPFSVIKKLAFAEKLNLQDLQRSINVPPLTAEASASQTTTDFSEYYLYAEQLVNFIEEDLVSREAMKQVTEPYNYYYWQLTLKHDHYVSSYKLHWSNKSDTLREMYEEFNSLHSTLRALNQDLDQIFRKKSKLISAEKKLQLKNQLARYQQTLSDFIKLVESES